MSSEKRRLMVNLASLFFGFFVVRCISFVATLYLTNRLGVSRFGVLSSGLATAIVLSPFLNAGLDDYLVREVAHSPEQKHWLFGDALLIKLLLLPLGLLLVLGLALANHAWFWVFIWLGLYSIVYSFLTIGFALFRGMERMVYQTSLQIIHIVLIAVGTVGAVWLTDDITITAISYLAATSITVAVAALLLYVNRLRPQFRWQPALLRHHIVTALPFGINLASVLIFDRMAILCISFFTGEQAVGLFSSVYNITLIMTVVPQIVATTMLPVLVRRARDDRGAISPLMASIVKYVVIIGIGIGLGLLAGSPIIIRLFDPEYQSAMTILNILALSLPFVSFTIVTITILEAIGEQRVCALVVGKALSITVPLSIVAAIYGGYLGSTAMYVASHMLLAGFMYRVAADRVGWTQLRETLVLPLGVGLVVALAVLMGKIWSPWIVLPVAILAYGGALFWSGALGKQDISLARGLFRRTAYEVPVVAAGSLDNE